MKIQNQKISNGVKNKISRPGRVSLRLIIILIVVLAAGVAIGIYFSKGDKEKGSGSVYGPEATEEGVRLEKEAFSVNVPGGWSEMGAPTGISAMAVNTSEEITDPAAKKINFRTYFSVVYDTLSGRNREAYIQFVRDSLGQTIPNINITHEQGGKVNNRDAYFMETEFNQRGIDFKVLLVVVNGTGNDVWVVTFNTPKTSWDKYRDLFYRTADSFSVK